MATSKRLQGKTLCAVKKMSFLTVQIGKNIKAIRESKNLSQISAAPNCNMHFTYLSQIERGVRPRVSIDKLIDICKGLDTRIENLIPDEAYNER